MDRKAMALECREVERCGGNVLDFLREQGAVTPWGTWYRLQVEELHRKKHEIRDGKGTKMGKKVVLTPEVGAEVEKMIEAGQDPKPYLKANGSKNPSAHEFMIRKSMKKRQEEEIDSEMPEIKSEMPEIKSEMPEIKSEMPEIKSEMPEIKQEEKQTEPVIKIKEADGIVGTWRKVYGGRILFSKPAGNSLEKEYLLTLSAEEWMAIMKELPKVIDLFELSKEAGT